MARFTTLLLLGVSCGGYLVVPLYDEATVTVRHPGLRGRIVRADTYTPGPPPAVSPRWVGEGHVIALDDTLRLQTGSLQKDLPVPPDGRVDFPGVGKLICARRRVEEVRAELAKLLRDPEVKLAVAVPDPETDVAVVGLVNHQCRLRRGTSNLQQAIAFAGSLSMKSCLPQIIVVRPAEGRVIVCDLYRYAKERDERQNLKLFPGDVIVATALYDPERTPCAPEWAAIERFCTSTWNREALIQALRR